MSPSLAGSHSPAAFSRLDGLRAVVTGASTGIGRAIALEFARAGAAVTIHCRNSLTEAESTAEQCHDCGVEAAVVSADVATADGCSALIAQTWSDLQPVDLWVNNAGADILTGPEAKAPFEQKLATLYETDVRSCLLLSRTIGQRMKSRGRGVLLNIGWDLADRGMAGDSGELFATVKNAVMGFTRSLAVSLAPQVRVNCIAPGWIRTAWGESASAAWQERVLRETPRGRWGTPEDIARTARFLCSDEADFITGQVINVNGGAAR